MKRIISIILIVASAFYAAFCFTACTSGKTTLKVYNWGDYIDESVIKSFEQETGLRVIYDTYASNEDMYTKVKAGGDTYDVLVPSDYMIAKMIREGMLQKLDMAAIPNFKYIGGEFRNMEYDPGNTYSVPYMWGTIGILYNKKLVSGPVDSWKILWNKKYKKQILMYDSQRDSIAIALKMLGFSLNTKKTSELEKAKNALMDQKPLVLAYVGDDVKDKMIQGEAALAVVYSGDAVLTKRSNKDLEYVLPKEGSNVWFDCMVIPKTSKHVKEAEMFINCMCRTDIAYKNTMFIGYSTPQTEARKKLEPAVADDPTAYPSKKELGNCEVFVDLADSIKTYDRIWTEIKAK